MINWIKQLFGDQKVLLEATTDHVELTSSHLVVGLQLQWLNKTDQSIPIKEIQLRVYLEGRNKDPLQLYPLERFTRLTTRRAFEKSPVRPFALPAGEPYTEQMRFISQEVLDLPAGNYPAEVLIKDTNDVIYTNRITLEVEGKIKYRRSEEWLEEE